MKRDLYREEQNWFHYIHHTLGLEFKKAQVEASRIVYPSWCYGSEWLNYYKQLYKNTNENSKSN